MWNVWEEKFRPGMEKVCNIGNIGNTGGKMNITCVHVLACPGKVRG